MVNLARPPNFQDPRQMPPKEILAALGRIAVITASIEDILHGIYWKIAGLNEKVGATITEDARPNRLTEDILKIGHAASVSKAKLDDLKDIFSQYRELATKRNHCMHWLWEKQSKPSGSYLVTPPVYKRGHQPKQMKIADVRALGDELLWIEARLSAHEMDEKEREDERGRLGQLADVFVPTPWIDRQTTPNPKP